MPLFSQTECCFADPEDLAACRALLSNGSKSFFAASFFLPRSLRQPAAALYAFCRIADDAVDGEGDPAIALEELRQRVDLIYDDDPMDHPMDRAFAGAIKRFGLPRELPEALLQGFEWDAQGRRYEDVSGVYQYSARVAAVVGAMMSVLMGVRSPDVLARACDLGTAMQLTNICRDVGEDARHGRLYLPMGWMEEAGVDPEEFLAQPRFSPALGEVVERLLSAADSLYQRAESGIASLPAGCRPGIYAARLLYAEIGREVARNGYDSVSRRAVVPSARKLALLSQALVVTPFPGGDYRKEPLEENRFLVEAVASTPAVAKPLMPRRRGLGDKMLWVLDLFETLEQREREAEGNRQAVLPAIRNGG